MSGKRAGHVDRMRPPEYMRTIASGEAESFKDYDQHYVVQLEVRGLDGKKRWIDESVHVRPGHAHRRIAQFQDHKVEIPGMLVEGTRVLFREVVVQVNVREVFPCLGGDDAK